MESGHDLKDNGLGRLVAIEGDTDMIALQLRLLPQCPDILVFPDKLLPARSSSRAPFDARLFILDTHRAYLERTELAQNFLRSSMSCGPKIAFMNGGSVGAKAEIIEQLSKQLTNNDTRKAEVLYDELTALGISGLEAYEKEHGTKVDEAIAMPLESDNEEAAFQDADEGKDAEKQHPSLTAMQRAEELDSITAHLQASEEETVLTLGDDTIEIEAENDEEGIDDTDIRHQSCTIVLADDETRNYITADIVPVVDRKRATFGAPSPMMPNYRNSIEDPSTHVESCARNSQRLTAIEDSRLSRISGRTTPGIIEVGEARAIDVIPGKSNPSLKKISSVDRLFTPNTRGLIITLPSLKRSFSMHDITENETDVARDIPPSPTGFFSAPRVNFVKASETFIRRLPLSNHIFPLIKSKDEDYDDYAVKDGEVIKIATEELDQDDGQCSEAELRRFEPVLPLVEDLVIRLNDGNQSEILNYLVRSSTSISSPREVNVSRQDQLPSERLSSDEIPGVPKEEHENNYEPNLASEETSKDASKRLWRKYSEDSVRETSTIELLTPATTPPPASRPEFAQRFHDVLVNSDVSMIKTQNLLRDVLSSHFPSMEAVYQVKSSKSSWQTLWRPLPFDNVSSSKSVVDQIIAVGREDTVENGIFRDISAHIEKLGQHRDGPINNDRLDLGYLLQSAAMMASMLSKHWQPSNFSSEPDALAALLILQLDLYISCQSSTRLLILHFQADQLPIVLSLRQLLGNGLFKIAAVVDPIANDPPATFTQQPATKTFVNPLSNEGAASLNARHRQRGRPPLRLDSLNDQPKNTSSSYEPVLDEKAGNAFYKANFVLPSSASPSEISTFVASIRSVLVSISSFYIADVPNSSNTSGSSKPLSQPLRQHPATSTNSTTIASQAVPQRGRPLHASHSPGPTVVLGTSIPQERAGNERSKSRKSRSWDRGRERQWRNEKAWDNMFGETDEELDEYDRKLMPTFEKRGGKKANSRKALKWLGLA